MTPGALTTHMIKENNYFIISILKEMNDLLILKTINDGYEINLCANFSNG